MTKPTTPASSQPSRINETRRTGDHAAPAAEDHPQAGRVAGSPRAPEDANQAETGGDMRPPQGPGEEPGEDDGRYVPL